MSRAPLVVLIDCRDDRRGLHEIRARANNNENLHVGKDDVGVTIAKLGSTMLFDVARSSFLDLTRRPLRSARFFVRGSRTLPVSAGGLGVLRYRSRSCRAWEERLDWLDRQELGGAMSMFGAMRLAN